VKLLLLLLKLYPRTWRERYEIEMVALLEEHTITFFTLIDLLFGALDAHLDPHYRTQRVLSSGERMSRIRFASSTIFWAFPLFWLCWAAFLSDLSDAMWDPLGRLDPVIGVSLTLLVVGFGLAALAVIANGLCISFAFSWQTPVGRITVLRVLPLACFLLVFVCYCLALGKVPVNGWLFLGAAIASFLSTFLIILKGKINKEVSFASLVLTGIATIGMLVQLIAIVLWCSSLFLFHGTLIATSTSAVIYAWSYSDRITLFIAGIASMTLLTIVVVFTLVRGLQALTALTSPLKEETSQVMLQQERR